MREATRGPEGARDALVRGVYFALVFAFFWLFFTRIHPLVVYDTDDWYYTIFSRHGYPEWGQWNPTRILPEVLMPLFGMVAGFAIYPITGDLAGALTLSYALALALSIALYAYMFDRLLRAKLSLSPAQSILASAVFLLSHFLAFRSGETNNMYLFQSVNVTTVFYNTIPVLLNAGLIFYLEAEDGGGAEARGAYERSFVGAGLRCLLVYLAICSNLFASSVFTIYAALRLLREGIARLRRDGLSITAVAKMLRREALSVAAVLLWLVTLVFEAKGGRGRGLLAASGTPLLQALGDSLRALRASFAKLNRPWAVLASASVPLAILALLAPPRRGGEGKRALPAVCMLVAGTCLQTAYLALLASKTGAGYLSAPQVLLGIFAFAIPAAVLSLATLAKRFPRGWVAAPLLCFLMLTEILCPGYGYGHGHIFGESTESGTNVASCRAVCEYLVEQVKAADEQRLEAVEIAVPKFGTADNWPLAVYGAYRIPAALYKFGIILKPVAVTLVPDETLNARFGL